MDRFKVNDFNEDGELTNEDELVAFSLPNATLPFTRGGLEIKNNELRVINKSYLYKKLYHMNTMPEGEFKPLAIPIASIISVELKSYDKVEYIQISLNNGVVYSVGFARFAGMLGFSVKKIVQKTNEKNKNLFSILEPKINNIKEKIKIEQEKAEKERLEKEQLKKISEEKRLEKKIELVASLFEVSEKVNLNDLAAVVETDRGTLLKKLVEWKKSLSFVIDGDFVKIEKANVSALLDLLDSSYKEWGSEQKASMKKS